MNNLVETNQEEPKTTYSIPVLIAGVVVLFVTIVVALIGIKSASNVREADSVTISQAKTEAKAMVPEDKPEMKETIENALLDSQSTDQPSQLNLRNAFENSVGSDSPAVSVPAPVQSKPIVPAPAEPSQKLQAGRKNPADYDKNTLASRNPSKEAPSMPSFESRYQVWEQQIAAAQRDRQPEPSVGVIYSVNEVAPTGYLASGERKLVNFAVIQTEKELSDSFSLEQGERLYDAIISEVTDSGVFYQLADGKRTFVAFVTEREVKRQPIIETQPLTQPLMPVLPSNPGNGSSVTKISRGNSINETLAKAVVEQRVNPGKKNLLAFARLKDSYTTSPYFNDDVVVRKSVETDNDYFHQVKLVDFDDREVKKSKQDLSPCDVSYVGEPIRYTSSANLTLNEFLRDLQKLYGVSFIVDRDVKDDLVVLKVLDKPWNYVLEAILRSKSLEARCLTGDIISIEPKGKQQKVDQDNQKTEPLVLRKYTLQYVPLNSSSSSQIAGSVGGFGGGNSGGGSNGPGIESQINQLLNKGGNDNRASVSRVPNSNILAVYATERQQKEINAFIQEIDQPGYQVYIETNFYTVNDRYLRDLGGQFSAIVGNGLGNRLGGVTNIPPVTGGTGGGAQPVGSGLPPSFGAADGSLRAGGNTLFGASFTVGTATFEALFSAAEQKGIANSQARSTQAVLDGGTTEIKNGDTIIIPTTGSAGGALVNSGAITVNATQSAAIQPQVVIDKKTGEPVGVTLNLQLTNNAINRAYLGTATPVVATQSQSGTVRLPLNQTYVVSGFFTDSVVNNRNNTPGLSKLPGIGELFKRRTDQIDRNRLYFAITVRVVRDTDLIQIAAPSDINTSPVPPPAAQKPDIRKKGN